MTTQQRVFQSDNRKLLRLGKFSSLALSTLTLASFVCALVAVPISGSNASPTNGFAFPYLNTISQFPRDFIWQYVTLLQLVVFLIFVGIVRQNTKKDRQIYANFSNTFATISVSILAFAYYTQVMVVPSSLIAGETDGLALLIQYNPHGLFIALEELGYIFMSFSLWFLIPLADREAKKYRAIRMVLVVSCLMVLGLFVLISVVFGLNKQDRFEVGIVSMNWITLIVVGILFYIIYREEERDS